jgi:hypothetical protein
LIEGSSVYFKVKEKEKERKKDAAFERERLPAFLGKELHESTPKVLM